MKAKIKGSEPEPEAPAKIDPALHVQDRALSARAGAKKGWRKPSPLEAYYEKGQLGGGDTRYAAIARLEAGLTYAALFQTAQASGRDSTDLSRISGGARGLPLAQAQIEALRALASVQGHMGARDRAIVRMVCGEGYWPSEAVRSVCAGYKDRVTARFREALDVLIEALETTRRQGTRIRVNGGEE
jgi:hypothetical protein